MSFTIYPAIDLKRGQVVRLAEGDMARATVYADDPAAQARRFHDDGATALHVVDLDGAFAGAGVNSAAVESIVAAFPGSVQVGGGIRSRADIDRWLGLGVARVVVGTAALDDPELVRAAAANAPGRIVVAVDAHGGMVATRGWASVSTVTVADLAAPFRGCRRRRAAVHRRRPRRAAQGGQRRRDRRPGENDEPAGHRQRRRRRRRRHHRAAGHREHRRRHRRPRDLRRPADLGRCAEAGGQNATLVVSCITLAWLLISICNLRDFLHGKQYLKYGKVDRQTRPVSFWTGAVINLAFFIAGLLLIGYKMLLEHAR